MANYPYYNEPTHTYGKMTPEAGNGARTTATSAAEQRLVVDAVDKVFLLEPNKHPLTSLMNSVKASDGAYKGQNVMKASTFNPEFVWFFVKMDHLKSNYMLEHPKALSTY